MIHRELGLYFAPIGDRRQRFSDASLKLSTICLSTMVFGGGIRNIR